MNRVAIVGLLLCLNTFSVSAQMQITEIMYDPSGSDTGREWVEVQNTGGSAIDFTAWKFFEADTNHGIASTTLEHTTIEPQEFVIVTTDRNKFLVDFPSFTGKIFKSSFSLSNTGEVLAFKNDTGVVVDQYMYDTALGAAGDGNSLHKGSTWNAAPPTPGAAVNNSGGGGQTGNPTPTPQNVGTAATTSPVITGSGTVYVTPQLSGTITVPSVSFAGVETVLQGKAFISGGKDVQNPQFSWNFGDGTTGFGPSVTHLYKYPGTYHIALSITAPTEHNAIPVLEHGTLTVVAPEVSVSEGRDENGGAYVILENKTKYLLDVSSWIIQRDGFLGEQYVLPKNTFIGAFASVRFSQETTQFKNDGIQRNVEILFPNRVVVARYEPRQAVSQTTSALVSVPVEPTPRLKTYASAGTTTTRPPLVTQSANGVVADKTQVSNVPSDSGKSLQTEPLATTSDTSVSALAAVGVSPQEKSSSLLWYVLPLLLITMCGGIFLAIKKEPTVTDGYTIIEDGK